MLAVLSLQLSKARADAADANSQLQVLDQALKTLEAGDLDAIKRQYIDAVRKMAVVQVSRWSVGGVLCALCWFLPEQTPWLQSHQNHTCWNSCHKPCQ